MVICIDFDGTCVTHEYPIVGQNIGAELILKKLVEKGHELVLFTMRCDGREDGSTPLEDAVKWFESHGIPLYGVNCNPTQKNWTQSPKAFGHIYIDDAALGCPLIYPETGRPYVNWVEVERLLLSQSVL